MRDDFPICTIHHSEGIHQSSIEVEIYPTAIRTSCDTYIHKYQYHNTSVRNYETIFNKIFIHIKHFVQLYLNQHLPIYLKSDHQNNVLHKMDYYRSFNNDDISKTFCNRIEIKRSTDNANIYLDILLTNDNQPAVHYLVSAFAKHPSENTHCYNHDLYNNIDFLSHVIPTDILPLLKETIDHLSDSEWVKKNYSFNIATHIIDTHILS